MLKYRYRLGRHSYETSQTVTAAVLLLPTLIALGFLFIYPVIRVFYLSLTNTNTITNVSTWAGLKNFEFLLKNKMFAKAFTNTVWFTVGKLGLEVVISLMLAVMLDTHIPCRKFLRVSYFAPVIVPVVAASTIWMWLYDPTLGPLNAVLRALNLPTSNYIFSSTSALASIVAFAVWRGVQGISEDVIEAARIDGANEWNILTRIKLPLMSSIIGFVVMMGMIGCFQAFTEVDIMTQGGPNNSTLLMVNYIYNQAFGNAKMGRGAAASVLLFAVIFVLTLIQKIMKDRKEDQ